MCFTACVYIKLKNPKAAFRDAVTALKVHLIYKFSKEFCFLVLKFSLFFFVLGLQINPDSAKGYKARGMARAMLGEWAEAEKDLHLASMIDYDAEISDVLKEV